MSKGIKLETEFSSPREKLHYEESLAHLGVNDASRDGAITADEVDADKLEGGFPKLQAAAAKAGTPGLLEPSEIRGLSLRRNAVVSAIFDSPQKDATQAVEAATKTVVAARESLELLGRYFTSKRWQEASYAYVGAASEVAGLDRRQIGLADPDKVEGLRNELAQMAAATRHFAGGTVEYLAGAAHVMEHLIEDQFQAAQKINRMNDIFGVTIDPGRYARR
jgi:hypothetical protein